MIVMEEKVGKERRNDDGIGRVRQGENNFFNSGRNLRKKQNGERVGREG